MNSSYEAFDSAPVDWIHGDFFTARLCLWAKRRHTYCLQYRNKASFLLGRAPLPITTFHTGGVAFDFKSLWQFTSELLFIRSAGPVQRMKWLNPSCVYLKKTKYFYANGNRGYKGGKRIKRMCTFLPGNFREPWTWAKIPLNTHAVKYKKRGSPGSDLLGLPDLRRQYHAEHLISCLPLWCGCW